MNDTKLARRRFLKSAVRNGLAGGLFVMTVLFIKRSHDHPEGECPEHLCEDCRYRNDCYPGSVQKSKRSQGESETAGGVTAEKEREEESGGRKRGQNQEQKK